MPQHQKRLESGVVGEPFQVRQVSDGRAERFVLGWCAVRGNVKVMGLSDGGGAEESGVIAAPGGIQLQTVHNKGNRCRVIHLGNLFAGGDVATLGTAQFAETDGVVAAALGTRRSGDGHLDRDVP